jgi:Family of unknown function (DUF6082)
MSNSSPPSARFIPDPQLHQHHRWLLLRRTGLTWTGAIAAICLLLVIIAVSPFALRAVSGVPGIDWLLLSDVGQTYGAASAILSGIALVGVSASLAAQVRQVRADRIRAVREQHAELLRLTMTEPDDYAPVLVEQQVLDAFRGDPRQFFFTTMYINYLRFGYEMNVFTEENVQDEMRAGFTSKPLLRNWWNVVTPWWEDALVSGTRKQRRFARLLHDAAASTPPAVTSPASHSGNRPRSQRQAAASAETVRLGLDAARLGATVALVLTLWRCPRRKRAASRRQGQARYLAVPRHVLLHRRRPRRSGTARSEPGPQRVHPHRRPAGPAPPDLDRTGPGRPCRSRPECPPSSPPATSSAAP